MDSNKSNGRLIAVVLYPGVSALELVGTTSVLNRLGLRTGFQTVTVGKSRDPVDSDTPLEPVPEKTFAEVPHPFALIAPGGTSGTFRAMMNPAIRRYVRMAAETADVVGSVWTGSLILAAVGLLEGRQATTHWAAVNILESLGAGYQRQRWVEDGKFIMSAGVSAGIDMGLYLAARLTDETSARQVQLSLDPPCGGKDPYDPRPPFGRLNYDDMALRFRLGRLASPLVAPLLAAPLKRLTRKERAAASGAS